MFNIHDEKGGVIGMGVILNRQDIAGGLEKLIEEQNIIMNKINNGSAYTYRECKQRLKLMDMRDRNDYILNVMFGIQSFQYTKPEYENIELR